MQNKSFVIRIASESDVYEICTTRDEGTSVV